MSDIDETRDTITEEQSQETLDVLIEEWSDIPDYEYYQISNKGRVKSLGRYVASRGGGQRWKPERYLKLTPRTGGYLTVCLYNEEGPKTFLVHRLIGEAFIENTDDKPYICHRNGIPDDNRLSNLYWGNNSDNMLDRFKHGYRFSDETLEKMSESSRGEKHPGAKITKETVLYIRENPEDLMQRELAEKFDLTEAHVSLIVNNRCWTHI